MDTKRGRLMLDEKTNIFEIVLLVVGIGAAILGFYLIRRVYTDESGQLSWLMIIAVFNWLTLLVMFILLSLIVDVSKKEVREIKTIINLLYENKPKKSNASRKSEP
mgnify:CR=1 FL=1